MVALRQQMWYSTGETGGETMPTKYADLSPEDKARRNRQNAASRARYESKTYDKTYLRIRRNGQDGVTLDEVKQAAEAAGMSVNAWIIQAIKDKL